jgi:hypothetical protein
MAKKIPTAISEYMAKLGKKGGKASGAKRMDMPAEERRRIASLAAQAMWAKRRASQLKKSS